MNTQNPKLIHVNTENLMLCNHNNWLKIRESVLDEIKFFDQKYFETRDKSFLQIYFSGHGQKNQLFTEKPYLEYDKMIEYLVD